MPLLEVRHLTYTYGSGTPFASHAINDVSFSAEKGEIIGVIGHTGSGKSTLMQNLNGLIKPEKGEVILNGRNIWTEYDKISEVRFKVGLVFQYPEYQLFEETTEKDIAFGPTNMGLPPAEISARVRYAAEAVGLKADLLKMSPFDLSGGEKRRAAIAGVIAMKPELLVLDEPTAGLDPAGRDLLLSVIRDYRDMTGAAVIIVSHSMEDMAKIAEKLIVLNGGRVEMFDTTENVFGNSERLSEIGLDVPEVTKIAARLNSLGYGIRPNLFTVDELYRELRVCIGGGKNAE